MKLFEELMDKTAKFADEAVKVGKEALEQTKVVAGETMEKGKKKVAQLQLEADLKEVYKKLGEETYRQHKTGEKDRELLEGFFNEVDRIMADLEALLTAEANTVAGTVVNEWKEEATEIKEEIIEEAREVVEEVKEVFGSEKPERVCPACGAEADDDDIFCRGCGNKLN